MFKEKNYCSGLQWDLLDLCRFLNVKKNKYYLLGTRILGYTQKWAVNGCLDDQRQHKIHFDSQPAAITEIPMSQDHRELSAVISP